MVRQGVSLAQAETAPPDRERTTQFHHSSHRNLLDTTPAIPASQAKVDAIVVPTARTSANLDTAIELARQLGCILVALCSKYSSAPKVHHRAYRAGIELVAIDIGRPASSLMPSFATDEVIHGTIFRRRQDTSLKRNLGLVLGHLAGWRRIVFLDDDITIPRPEDLNDAVALLDNHDTVGLHIDGFPDNSVVCHAFRNAGGRQDTFVGGGAIAVDPTTTRSFFPNVYNEDWFFLLDNVQLRKTTIAGRAVQQPYDPFANTKRARAEEFGDCLAEGVFWLLDNGWRVKDADEEFWERFLRNRLKFINEVLDAVTASPDIELAGKGRMVEALKAARGRNLCITPALCARYLHAWRIDRRRWQRHIEEFPLPIGNPVEKVLSDLGLAGCSRYLAPVS
jgi:hypothetical protein